MRRLIQVNRHEAICRARLCSI